ncbi:MAG TPA: universal stress protein [Puia sp.]|jgi:nucleotide-binding universal stress UspA family protein|nr:universal stress protein [Puia sp.]
MSSPINSARRLRILVPTDLSAASRAGLRFAIQWSRQRPAELLFVHVVNIPKPPAWTEKEYKIYFDSQCSQYRQRLKTFVRNIYRQVGVPQRNSTFLLLEAISADVALQDYCQQDRHIDFICMSTRGAGRMKRLFGTHTGNLITHSKVPVLAVPSTYRARPIRRLLYAGDMIDYDQELRKVLEFARPLNAGIDLLHLTEAGEIALDKKMTEKIFREQFNYPFRIHFRQPDQSLSFPENLNKQILAFKPSVVILFTDQRRSILARIVHPSKAEKLSFDLKAPLLVFSQQISR